MSYKNNSVYKKIMQHNPVIEKEYISEILKLSKEDYIRDIQITDVVESNTALTMKAEVRIESPSSNYIKKLFIKTVTTNGNRNGYIEMSLREGDFYQFVHASKCENIPIPTCYDAYVNTETKDFVIILEDISDSYQMLSQEKMCEEEYWFSCAESLAKLHAKFWNNYNQNTNQIKMCNSDDLERSIQENHEHLKHFLRAYGDNFNERIEKIFKQAMKINDELMRERIVKNHLKENVTICNGDSHIYNFMISNDEKKLPVIVDFQFWSEGYGTGDLAHLTRVSFPEQLKKEMQLKLVKYYYEKLVQYGVTGYTWEDCLNDYRKDVAAMVLIPLWQACCFGVKYEEWRPEVDGLVDNFEYMGCEKLLHI